MTIHLLNAAVMPQEGHYELQAISSAQFAESVRAAYLDGNLRHYIGYQSTLNLIADLCRIDLGEINVGQTELDDGDIFYVARLRRRVSPLAKRVETRGHAAELEISDFDFFCGKYSDLPATFNEVVKK